MRLPHARADVGQTHSSPDSRPGGRRPLAVATVDLPRPRPAQRFETVLDNGKRSRAAVDSDCDDDDYEEHDTPPPKKSKAALSGKKGKGPPSAMRRPAAAKPAMKRPAADTKSVLQNLVYPGVPTKPAAPIEY
eukprot:273010-Pyramimonas_sp.AAC.1